MQLVTKFAKVTGTRSDFPLTDDMIRRVAPSVFASEPHSSRSERYTFVPTVNVLAALRLEGFSPFMVCQSKCRNPDRTETTKHMLRLRHARQVDNDETGEIILINSHGGQSSYQMLAGTFRFVCSNGTVHGDIKHDIRLRHKGDIIDNVIDGAFKVLDDFKEIEHDIGAMKSVTLNKEEQNVFAHAALALKYDTERAPAPVTESQILRPQRVADLKPDLWTTLNVVQEHIIRGGLVGRNANGNRTTTREVAGIDGNVKLNRALWLLAEGMRALKA